MTKRTALLTLAALVITLAAAPASAVDFNGYLRSGVGGNNEGGSQACFSVPNLPFKFRLGNECETYAELGFGQNLYKDKATGLSFRYEGMLAYVTAQNQDYESLKGSFDLVDNPDFDPALPVGPNNNPKILKNNSPGNDIANRQNFIIATLPNGLQVWGGKRYYHRQNVDQIDFYYWDPSGYGFGVENIDLGFAKLAVALFQSDRGATRTNWRPDVRLEGINVGFGAIDVGVDGSYVSSKDSIGDAMKFSPGFTVQHKVSVLGGQNTLAVQYGLGAYAQLDKYVSNGRTSDSKGFRVVENLLFQLTPEISGAFAAEFEDLTQIYSNDPANDFAPWNSRQAFSIGVRPAYRVNEWFKFAGEAGYQTLLGKGTQKDLSLYKITLAPTVTTPAGTGGEYLTRPEIRVFVTYAGWNNDAKGQIGGPAFADKTSGLTAGAQVEAWW